MSLSTQIGTIVQSLQPRKNGGKMKNDLKPESERQKQQRALEEELRTLRTPEDVNTFEATVV